MRQIINITQARNNFSQLISKVTETNESVIILRDSEPAAVVISYEDFTQLQKEKETMWKMRFDNLMQEIKGLKRSQNQNIPTNVEMRTFLDNQNEAQDEFTEEEFGQWWNEHKHNLE